MRKFLFLIGMAMASAWSCNGNRRSITPHCHLFKEAAGYSVVTNREFVNDTLTQVSQIGWKGDWVYVWGRDSRTGREGWMHIWDNTVLKHYGPIAEEQSYYGRKDAEMYTAEEAWEKLE